MTPSEARNNALSTQKWELKSFTSQATARKMTTEKFLFWLTNNNTLLDGDAPLLEP